MLIFLLSVHLNDFKKVYEMKHKLLKEMKVYVLSEPLFVPHIIPSANGSKIFRFSTSLGISDPGILKMKWME